MFKLKCILTGRIEKIPKKVPKRLAARIARFSTRKEYEPYHLCNDAIRELKAGLTVDEARKKLGTKNKVSPINETTMTKLRSLYKIRKKRKPKTIVTDIGAYTAMAERSQREFEKKVAAIMSSKKTWVEYFTGNNTCIRPDISVRDKCCNECPYNEYCLCKIKKIKKRWKKSSTKKQSKGKGSGA